MSKESLEHLSSLMDGEINRDTGRFIIRRLGSDAEMRGTWARYHLVRDCLRFQEGSTSDRDFCAGVREALENEPAASVRPIRAARWLKPVSGMAIAASVALMAIVTVGTGPGALDGTAPGAVADSEIPAFVSPNGERRSLPVSQQASTAGITGNREKMNPYLLRHYQMSGSAGGKGFVTFVPIVLTRNVDQPAEVEPAEPSPEIQKNGTETVRQ